MRGSGAGALSRSCSAATTAACRRERGSSRSSSPACSGVEDVGSTFEGTVAYHPTCHSLRLLRVGDAPLRLLRAVPGVELVELPDAEECCGFGGTFAVKNADVSAAMLDEKLAAIAASGAESVCACDSSCLMHIGGGLRRRGSAVRPVHLAEILAS